MTEKIVYTNRDFSNFRQWICLDIKSVTWQGKYAKDFEIFWESFFSGELSLMEVNKRFSYALDKLKVGPLTSWISWLRAKFIAFTFIEKDVSVKDIVVNSGLSSSEVSQILRNFFVDVFPHLEDYFNDLFLITNSISKNLSIKSNDLIKELDIELNFSGSHDEEVMTAMEVTLYEDWAIFIKKMQSDFSGRTLNLQAVKSKASFKKTIQLFSNAIAIVGITIFVVWALEFANRKYEQYLADKISIYEPQFRWENEGLKFTDDQKREDLSNFELDIEDIEKVDDTENFLGESLEEGQRDSVESEVVLTSWDTLPKDFDVADAEKSQYEEATRRGYRDSRYGNTKVYRVMMRSSDTSRSRTMLTSLLDNYKVTQVDNVKPGLAVPGGFYYNLYVPRIYLKEFMAKVQSVDTAVIYESRTRTRRNPPGKNKVFIWVKAI